MGFDFEALVGHLYVVGGRSISAPPPGALVEVAPKKAVRGRETETFFALVLPSGDATAPTAFYEQMAKLAAERYFNITGSVTSALRSAFNHLNENLVEHNRLSKRHYEANMLAGVLRDSDLIVARVGAGAAVIRLQGETKTYPENLHDDEALFGPPLGVQPIPDVRMTRYPISSGMRLLLSDSNLADIPIEQITNALATGDIAQVLGALKELASKQATVMAVEFVLPDVPIGLPVKEGKSTAEIVTPKVTTAEIQQAAVPTTPTPSRERRKPLNEAAQKMQTSLQHGAGTAALQTSRAMTTLDKLLDRVFPEPKEGQRKRFGAPLITMVMLIVPVGVVALVILAWFGGIGPTELELCIQEANSRAQLARSFDPNNRTDILSAWDLVLEQVETCDTLRPNDAFLARLKQEGQSNIDGLNQITRRQATVVTPIRDAAITQFVLQGSDIYALDGDNGQVYRIALAANGLTASGAPQPIPNMRQGAAVGQNAVGELVGIAFSNDDKVIMAVDRTGLVITCQPRFITQCDSQRLAGAENWRAPVAIAVWGNKLYILDTGANQIWRYEQTGGQFAAPTEYFTGTQRPSLITAIDFGIDSDGVVYILRSDGVLTKYRSAETQDYAYAAFPETPNAANAVYINDSAIFPGLMIVNRANKTIYETTRSGTWSATFRVFDEDQFALLSDVAVDPSQQLIYAASGNAILVFQRG